MILILDGRLTVRCDANADYAGKMTVALYRDSATKKIHDRA